MKLVFRKLLGAIFLVNLLMMNMSIYTFHMQRKKHMQSAPEAKDDSILKNDLINLKGIVSLDTVNDVNDVLWRVSSVVQKLGPASGFLTGLLTVIGYENGNTKLLNEIKDKLTELQNTIERNQQELLAAINISVRGSQLDKEIVNIKTMIQNFFQLFTNPKLDTTNQNYLVDGILRRNESLIFYLSSLDGSLIFQNNINVPNKYGVNAVTIITLIANYDNGATQKLKHIISLLISIALFGVISYKTAKLHRNITVSDELVDKLNKGVELTKNIFTYVNTNKIQLAKDWISSSKTAIVEWSNSTGWYGTAPLPGRIMDKLLTKFQVKSSVICLCSNVNSFNRKPYKYHQLISIYNDNGWCLIDIAEDRTYNYYNSERIKNNIKVKNSSEKPWPCNIWSNEGNPALCLQNQFGETTFYSSNINGAYYYRNSSGEWTYEFYYVRSN